MKTTVLLDLNLNLDLHFATLNTNPGKRLIVSPDVIRSHRDDKLWQLIVAMW